MSIREQGPSLLSGLFVWLALLALLVCGVWGLGFFGQTIAQSLSTTSVSCKSADGTLVARCKLERGGIFFGNPETRRDTLEIGRPGPQERQRLLTFMLPVHPAHLKGISMHPDGGLIAVDLVRTGDQARVLGVMDLRGLDRELNHLLGATVRETRSAVYRERLEIAIRTRYVEVAYPASWDAVMTKLPAVPAPVRPRTPRSPRDTEGYEIPAPGGGAVSAAPETLGVLLARSAPGSVIVLKPGAYSQCPPIPAGVTLVSESPYGAVFGRGVVLGGNVRLAGIRFLDVDGPAVRATDEHNVRIENCLFDEIYGGCAIALQECRGSIINGNIVSGVFCSDRGDAVGISISGGSAEISGNVVSEISENGHGDAVGIRVENATGEITHNIVAHVRERAWGSARGIECRGDGRSRTLNNTIVDLSETEWDESTGICYEQPHEGAIAGNVIDRIEGYGWNHQYRIEAIQTQTNSVALASNMVGQVRDTDEALRRVRQNGATGLPAGTPGTELPFLDFAGGDLRLPSPAGDMFGAYAAAPIDLTITGPADGSECKPYEGEVALCALREFIACDFEAEASAPVLHVAAHAGKEQDGSVDHPFSFVRTALKTAGPGCTIIIGPGVFSEGDLALPAGVSLRGAGRRRTVISGALSIGSNSTIASFTLRGWRSVLVEAEGACMRVADVEVWPTRNTCIGIASKGEIEVIGCHIHGIHGTRESTTGGKPAWKVDIHAIVATGSRAHIRGTVISDVRKQQWANNLVAVSLATSNALVERCVLHDVISPDSGNTVMFCAPGASAVIRNNTIWRCGVTGGGYVTGVKLASAWTSRTEIDVSGNLTGGLFAHGGAVNIDSRPSGDNCGFPQVQLPAKGDADPMDLLTRILSAGPEFLDPRSGDYRIKAGDPAAAFGAYAPAGRTAPGRFELYHDDLPIVAHPDMSFDTLYGMLTNTSGVAVAGVSGTLVDKLRGTPPPGRSAVILRFLPLLLAQVETPCHPDLAGASCAAAEFYQYDAPIPPEVTVRTVEALIGAMKATDGDCQLTISRALCRLGSKALGSPGIDVGRILAALEPMLLESSEKTGGAVAGDLRMLGGAAVPLLMRGLASDKYVVMCNSVWALGDIGPAAQAALPMIEEVSARVYAKRYQQETIRGHAREAIGKIRR